MVCAGRRSVNVSDETGEGDSSVLSLGDCLTISPWRKDETKSERDEIVRNNLPTQHLEEANN